MADDVPEEEKARRIVALQARQRDIQTALNAALVGRQVEILVDAASRRRDSEVSGRTSQNVVVNLPGSADAIGQLLMVSIERSGAHSVWGKAASHAS
jgi:tRNA-2-methylthio-N6-dimethylallyladenosine synthase